MPQREPGYYWVKLKYYGKPTICEWRPPRDLTIHHYNWHSIWGNYQHCDNDMEWIDENRIVEPQR